MTAGRTDFVLCSVLFNRCADGALVRCVRAPHDARTCHHWEAEHQGAWFRSKPWPAAEAPAHDAPQLLTVGID